MKNIRIVVLIALSSLLGSWSFAQQQQHVLRNPEVSIAYAYSSNEHVAETVFAPKPLKEHRVRPNPFLNQRVGAPTSGPDGSLQPFTPFLNMPSPLLNFFGQGSSYDGASSTSPGSTTTGDPPDTNGAVGPNHYVQAVNGGYIVFNKSGTQLQAPRFINNLWSGYTGTNAGNGCAANNDGDPIVMYDQLADRWFITQFSLPNTTVNAGPSFQCVAVSKTGDPTGAYWLYDFQYAAAVNDYGKFAVWPDAYYATFNNFATAKYIAAEMCAYDRTSMLAGLTATQQCFTNANDFGILPTSLEGTVRPPSGRTQFLVSVWDTGHLAFYQFHVDWATTANTTLTGPTLLTIPGFTYLCGGTGGTCVAQPSPGNQLDTLGDRPMWRATYRNFGTLESVTLNHSVVANSTSGVRWYEIRSPGATTPTVFQSGTYAVNDGNYRWMGSIAQDQAQDMALGFSVSGGSHIPSIAWTGRLGTDATGSMTQTESTVHSGAGVESGTFSSGAAATRWGDYSNMTVDPSDDCTFWYTTEDYPANGIFNWDTRIAAVKFPTCAANNFSISVSPSLQTASPGGAGVTYTVSTAATAGTPESIALNIQDLPTGVTAGFSPATVTAGSSSTLTLTAGAAAPLTASPVTFTVIGKATSAVHANTAQVSVGTGVTPVPANVVATASIDASQVAVTWTAVAGATYEVYRKGPLSTASFTLINSPTTNSFTDSATFGLAANSAYLYRVRAVIAGVSSLDSAADLATTVAYTDNPIVAGSTFIKAEHLTQLRTAITAVAALANTTVSFTDTTITPSTTPIKSVHVTEIRTALDAARSALGLPPLSYTNSAASNTVIHATDFTELRTGMQ